MAHITLAVHVYANPPHPQTSLPPTTIQRGWPAFTGLDVRQSAQGWAFVPRGNFTGLWIEAMVWLVGFALLGAGVAFGGDVLRAIACIGLVGIGVRALVRTIRAISAPAMRTLRLVLRVPRPALAGAFESILLCDLARLSVTARGNALYLLAETHGGKGHWLTEVEQEHVADYEQLIAAMGAFLPART